MSFFLLLGITATGIPAIAQPTSNPPAVNPASPTATTILYVNPATGSDRSGAGTTAAQPYRTLSYALQQAQPNTRIVLAAGTYSPETGEVFPLRLKPGIALVGNPETQGTEVVIRGGGQIGSSSFGRQNAAILAAPDSQISGVTVTNPNTRGTGIWIESTNAIVTNSTFRENLREGIFVTGSARPRIENNLLINNSANGISVTNRAQGEFRNNVFRNTGFGMAIGGEAQPRVSNNLFTENRAGIVLSETARPILRQNQFRNNQDGLVLPNFSQAQPDLGTATEPGNNVFQGNQRFAIYNATRGHAIAAVGNQLDPSKISGAVSLSGTTSGSFADVGGNWAAPYIQALAAKEIIGGFPDGSFRPNAPVTRAQFATILQKAFNLNPPGRTANPFQDVPSSFWGAQAIRAVVQGGFMSGYPSNEFRPNQEIPRVQAIVALAKGLNLTNADLSSLTAFKDAAQIPAYARPAVAAALQKGILLNPGSASELQPLQNATRADVAAWVYQALVSSGRAEPIAQAR